MKISVLTPDLSHNCLGRAYLLAKILQRRYKVEIVGPILGDGIWKPVANHEDIKYISFGIEGIARNPSKVNDLVNKINGDIIYVSKPLFTSFGVGILSKFKNHQPLILDIDDWQMGLMSGLYQNLSLTQRVKNLIHSARYPHLVASYWNNLISEKLTWLSNEITVSNHFLKQKFNGSIVWHARDTEFFDPEKYNKDSIKDNFEIPRNKKIIMFLGTPRSPKGVEDLVEAVALLRDQNIVLAVVGLDDDKYSQSLSKLAQKSLGERFRGFGLQAFEKAPEFLAMSDVVVIPQRKSPATIGQVPAKVFDAMAMAKPTIATNVSDLPIILDGCGWIVEPEQPKQLAKCIQHILNHPEEAEQVGQKARKKCIENYSFSAMENVLFDIFKKYE
jgi:glycosyltransferase involved in cell wall biosynthesis